MRKAILISLFCILNLYPGKKNNELYDYFNTIKQLYRSDDVIDQLIFNELHKKVYDPESEVWPDDLKDEYHCRLGQKQLINELGNPKPEVSRIMKTLVKSHIWNGNRRYFLVDPIQKKIIFQSPALQKQLSACFFLGIWQQKKVGLLEKISPTHLIQNSILW